MFTAKLPCTLYIRVCMCNARLESLRLGPTRKSLLVLSGEARLRCGPFHRSSIVVAVVSVAIAIAIVSILSV